MTSRQRLVQVMAENGVPGEAQEKILSALRSELMKWAYTNRGSGMAYTILECFSNRLHKDVDDMLLTDQIRKG